MSKAKEQGTRLETAIVNELRAEGFTASRLAEGGLHDLGDITLTTGTDKFIIEAKSRERLNITRELGKAIEKGGPNTVLWWKRLVKTGKQKRQADGVPAVVVMTPSVFIELLKASERKET